MSEKKRLVICENGHRFYKSSSCNACPKCALNSKPETGLLSLLPAPARRALEAVGILSEKDIVRFSARQLLELHGFGKSSLPIINQFLSQKGLHLKQD